MDTTGGSHPSCQITTERSFCWACSIPELVWAKFALLNCMVSYNITEDKVIVIQPVLAAANYQQQAAHQRLHHGQRWPPVPPVNEIKCRWEVKPRTAKPEDWHNLASEIADALAWNSYGEAP